MTLSFAQNANQTENKEFDRNDTTGMANILGFERVTSSYEFLLSISIVLLTIFILIFEFFVIFKAKHITFKPEDVLRLIVTTLVVCGTLFFLAAGFSSEQIAPAVGLFGTVVGYLLGSAEKNRSSSTEDGGDEPKNS
ncbi:hypothetical protein [Rhizobium leguminosarum]|uniref:Uncharacterized protein n=1 Tax=Rhizobium leguminosarum TaxID=384 RepID=A0A7K3VHE3_RHILE|nr:hypothetical protein [Rhizobium leguminosarum]NEK16202.1 hypothetical protein [Rhizobium leguminosarum]